MHLQIDCIFAFLAQNICIVKYLSVSGFAESKSLQIGNPNYFITFSPASKFFWNPTAGPQRFLKPRIDDSLVWSNNGCVTPWFSRVCKAVSRHIPGSQKSVPRMAEGSWHSQQESAGMQPGLHIPPEQAVVLRWLALTALCPAGSVLLLCWPALVKLPLIYGFSLCEPWL